MRLQAILLATVVLCAACGGGNGTSNATDQAPPAALRQAFQANPATRQAVPTEPSLATVNADQVMDWAEAHMPDRFPGHSATLRATGFVYRYYAASGNFIAVSDAGDVGVLQPALNARVGYVGTLAGLGCTVNPALTCLPYAYVPEAYGDWPVGTYVARTDDAWAQAWATRRILEDPVRQRPAIDFSRYMVLGIALGAAGGCDSFGIRRLIDEPQALRVEYATLHAPPGTTCVASIWYQTSFVQVAKTDKPVYFIEVNS